MHALQGPLYRWGDRGSQQHAKFTLQAGGGCGHAPWCPPRVQRPGLGAAVRRLFPRQCLCLPASAAEGGALPLHERAFSLLPVSASVPGSLQGTRHIGRQRGGRWEEMTPKGNTNHVEKDLFFKNSPSCLSSRAGVSHPPAASASRGAAPLQSFDCPAAPQPAAPAEGPQGPRLWAPLLAGGGRAPAPPKGAGCRLHGLAPSSPAAVLWASPRSASSRRACWEQTRGFSGWTEEPGSHG